MTHLELREKFFAFWEKREHKKIPSSSLVPENDPTTLFTGSGMQPLIPYLLGQPHPLGKRLVDIQKCFRGQDIMEVGNNRHDTFFEMYGNWSLGDYFKKEQLAWYWEFLTKVLGFNPKRLHIACFAGYNNIPKDTESGEIWKSLGVPEERIYFYSVAENWWSRSGGPKDMPAGEIGGPDSEVFYEFTIPHDPKFGKNCHPNCQCGKFLEIGNSVFIQYQKQPNGSFKQLSQRNVDFGGGLERTLAALADDPDFYLTSVHKKNIEALEKISGKTYDQSAREFRIVADHIKSAVFLVAAGVTPSNVDRGYILRRLIRRAVRVGDTLGIKKDFVIAVADANIAIYESVYPELPENQKTIHETMLAEETRFRKTLEKGLAEFAKLATKKSLSPQEVFYLYESFGFPYELTEEEAKKAAVEIADRCDFDEEYKKHQEESKAASRGKFAGGLADHSQQVVKLHTATHLLQAALRNILGDHVRQEGSNITAERLRFDFSHPQKMTAEEIKNVEQLVNEKIRENLQRKIETLTYDEAIKSGALAFFKEKYPQKVTVYSFGPSPGSERAFSREICGGPHVANTKMLGQFKILRQEAVAAGARRIYASLA